MSANNDDVVVSDELQLAAKYLALGNLAAADIHCRRVMDAAPAHPAAHNMVGVIAALLGLNEHAAQHFARAIAADRGFQIAAKNLARLKGLVTDDSAQPPDERRFLLIKAWGYGFWSDVSHVLGCLLLAELSGRIPLTHWGNNSRFTDGAVQDAFEYYFEPVSEYSLEDLLFEEAPGFFPAKWSTQNLRQENFAKWQGEGSRSAAISYLNRAEIIAVSDFYVDVMGLMSWIPQDHPLAGKSITALFRYLIEKYLRPQKTILADVENFSRRHFTGSRLLAVHLRGSDKQIEMGNTADINRQYFDAISRMVDASWRIFLLTDDARWVDAFRKQYGDRLILADCQRTSNDRGIHYDSAADHVRLGMEVMQDTYLATRADKFLGNGQSSVSVMIMLLKQWADSDCKLLAPSVLFERNSRIYVQGVAEAVSGTLAESSSERRGDWLF